MLVTLTVVVTLKKKSFDSSTVINKHTVTSLISLKIYWPHHDTILKRESRLWGPKIFIQIFSQNIHPIFNNARMRYQWEVWYILEIEEKKLEAGLDISLSEQRRRRQILIYKTVLWRNSVTTIQVSCQKIWLSSILILNRLIQSSLNCKSSPLRLIRVCQSKRRDIQNRIPHKHKLEVAKVLRSVTRLTWERI